MSKRHTLALRCLWLGLLLSLIVGCHFDRVGVGGECNGNSDCDRGLFCDLGAPGGYCSVGCSELLPCPNAALCGTIEGVSGNEAVTFQRCFQRCGVRSDCRNGYHCRLMPGSLERVCFPYASCRNDDDCGSNERCTTTPSGQQRVCIPRQ